MQHWLETRAGGYLQLLVSLCALALWRTRHISTVVGSGVALARSYGVFGQLLLGTALVEKSYTKPLGFLLTGRPTH